MRPKPQCVLRHVGRMANEADTRSDDLLLAAFLQCRDEAAFAALIARHGPVVLGVCRRLLRDAHDIEDAFQASFLVLLRKAGSLRRRERLGAWLYGVAYRVALKARFVRARQRATERPAEAMIAEPTHSTPTFTDGVELLDRELLALPERYRQPLILCELQGLSRREAARQLGLPEGTLSSRLARGRQLLRQRLVDRGVVLSASALFGLLTERARASVPLSLVESTLLGSRSLLAGVAASVKYLMEGVLNEMLLTKLKIITTVTLLIGCLISVPLLVPCIPAADRPIPATTDSTDRARIEGVWRLERVNGRAATAGELKETYGILVFDGSWATDGDGHDGPFQLNESASPKELDWTIPGGMTRQWIYKLENETLTLCGKVAELGTERPKEFVPGKFEKTYVVQVMTYRRVTGALKGSSPLSKEAPTANRPPKLGLRHNAIHIVVDDGNRETVVLIPFTGNDTVLDAVEVIKRERKAPIHVWIARPDAKGENGKEQILPVDWRAISRDGDTKTNFQLLRGDRVFMAIR